MADIAPTGQRCTFTPALTRARAWRGCRLDATQAVAGLKKCGLTLSAARQDYETADIIEFLEIVDEGDKPFDLVG